MKFVYWLFGLDRIYEIKYGMAFIMDATLLYFAVMVFSLFFEGMDSEIFGVNKFPTILFVLVTLYLLRELIQTLYVWRKIKKRIYIKIPTLKFLPFLSKSSVRQIYDKDKLIDTTEHLIEEQSKWRLYDAEFNFYRKTKHGKYKSKQLYYTVMEMDLQRVIPHVIFDSKTAKGKQFRFNYLQSQRVSFEGNFDDIFESYAPQTYQIDTLSFISPEVMQAMLGLKDCDIEFVDNKLLCFAPLLRHNELDDFKNRALNLYKNVDDNLDTYMDNRLSGQKRREDITSFARQLLQNPMKHLPLFLLTGIAAGGTVYVGFNWGWRLMFDRVSLFIWITFIATGYKMIKLMIDNRKKEKAFFERRQTTG